MPAFELFKTPEDRRGLDDGNRRLAFRGCDQSSEIPEIETEHFAQIREVLDTGESHPGQPLAHRRLADPDATSQVSAVHSQLLDSLTQECDERAVAPHPGHIGERYSARFLWGIARDRRMSFPLVFLSRMSYRHGMTQSAVRRTGRSWGERVSERRRCLGWTQRQLAERCARFGRPLAQPTISKIERGLLTPRDPLKIVLARALETTPDQLFPWQEL